MSTDADPQIVSDVLYGISMRPQELELYKDYAQFRLRYSPIFDDPEEEATEHFKLLVVEVHCQLPPDIEVGRHKGGELDLLRCGWQLEMKTAAACRVDSVPELPEELPLLLGKVAETVNRLAEDAHIDGPLPDEALERLLKQYRQRHG